MCLFLLTICDHFRKTAVDLSIVSQGGKHKPALTKVADGGKVHSVAGRRFTVAVLRADYRVTSVSFSALVALDTGPLRPPLALQSSSVRLKAFPSRWGVYPGPHAASKPAKPSSFHKRFQCTIHRRRLRPKTRISIPKHVKSFGLELYKCETFIFVENKGSVRPSQRSVAFINSYHWSYSAPSFPQDLLLGKTKPFLLQNTCCIEITGAAS